MNKIFVKSSLVIILAIILSIRGNAQARLTISVRNIADSQGTCVLNLFRKQDELPENPFKSIVSPIQKGKVSIVIEGLPEGDYEAIVYHDKNGNGILDHLIGFPNEPMGFSNHWQLSLFSGMPTFSKLKFTVVSDTIIEMAVD